MNQETRIYLAEIGAKGGVKRKHHPDRSKLARAAANARWEAIRKSKPHEKVKP